MKKWGIWGLGIVGKSVVRHLSSQNISLAVYDARELSKREKLFLRNHKVKLYTPNQQDAFFSEQDVIVPSPGINRTSVKNDNYMHELDLFNRSWRKPIIAITGSVGKTTLTSALSQVLHSHSIAHALGGNIGKPLLDLLEYHDTVDYALLELSSFQLEEAQPWSPEVAIITNIYPNHLDRHTTMNDYFMAKYQLIKHQQPGQKTVVPLTLAQRLHTLDTKPRNYFCVHEPTPDELRYLTSVDTLYVLTDGQLSHWSKKSDTNVSKKVLTLSGKILTACSALHRETTCALLASCDLLGVPLDTFPDLGTLEHRLEKVPCNDARTFYNDSKSTIMESTLGAVSSLSRPVYLLLGGLSKGVDRRSALNNLKTSVKTVACFGEEAAALYRACTQLGIEASEHRTLDDAFNSCIKRSETDDTILLSPGGTSFDLYKNYQERGKHFKELIKNYEQKLKRAP